MLTLKYFYQSIKQWVLQGSVINIDLNWLETCKGDKDQLMEDNEAAPMLDHQEPFGVEWSDSW